MTAVAPYNAGAPTALAPDRLEKASMWPYVALLGYFASFCYVIPVPAPGLPWAVWPTLTDFAAALLIAATFLAGKPRGFTKHPLAARLVSGLAAFLVLGGVSFVVINLGMNAGRQSEFGLENGVFYMYRTFQFALVAWAASQIPMSPSRLRGIAWVCAGVLLLAGATCLVNRVGIVPTSMLAPQIPASKNISGPWSGYADDALLGSGTLGYNHALGAAILVTLLALFLSLPKKPNALAGGFLVLYAVLAIAATGSRAGLATALIYALYVLFRNPILVVGAVVVGAAVYLVIPTDAIQGEDLEAAVEKQSELANPLESEQFQSRQLIWQTWSEKLLQEPRYLVTGVGFGAARDVAGLGHNQPLTVLGEFGVFGLLGALLAAGLLLRAVWRLEKSPRRFSWYIVVIYLSCMTQESLYPVPAMGHFPGLFCVAIVLFAGRVQCLRSEGATAVSAAPASQASQASLPGRYPPAGSYWGRPAQS